MELRLGTLTGGAQPLWFLEDSAAGRDLHRGDAARIQQQEPIAVSTAEHARVTCERRDDVVDDLVLAARIGVVVRDVHAVTADEPDTKHKPLHVPRH
jgi:hypothetical protein